MKIVIGIFIILLFLAIIFAMCLIGGVIDKDTRKGQEKK